MNLLKKLFSKKLPHIDREKSIENISTIRNQIKIKTELIIRQNKLTNDQKKSLFNSRDLFLAKTIEM